jgi:hypothetical protein
MNTLSTRAGRRQNMPKPSFTPEATPDSALTVGVVAEVIGRPHCGQAAAAVDISREQSGQVVRPMCVAYR